MTKDQVLYAINNMPKEFDLEELIEKLLFVEKVEKGLAQLDEGKSKSNKEAKKLIKSWQK